jgi:hypothetical protein
MFWFALPPALPILAGLSSPTALALLTSPITPIRLLAVPAAGCCPTGLTAIATQGVPRLKAPFTAFEQTDTTPQTPRAVLQKGRFFATL